MKPMDLRPIALFALALGWAGLAGAAHAPANSTISNTASVQFTVGTVTSSQNSNTDTLTVDELADVAVARQSPSPVTVLGGATNQPIRFRVTNLGNGSEQFDLSANLALGADQFDPTNAEFYIDDGDGVFEPGIDDGAVVTSITLAGETFGDVWLVADIPGAVSDGDLGNVSMAATASQGTGVPGSEIVAAGDGGVDLVFGNSGGTANDTGAYQVSNITITITKASVVTGPLGNQPVPTSTITYTITVTTAGTATATAVAVEDDFPANTTYVLGSMTVNAVAKTDLNDAEAAPTCDSNITNVGGIHCLLGTLTGPTTNTVTFQVTIN